MSLTETLERNIETAFAEDIGSGDLTVQLIPEGEGAHATVISREAAVLCGTAWFEGGFRKLDGSAEIRWFARDGENVVPNQPLCEIHGNARHAQRRAPGVEFPANPVGYRYGDTLLCRGRRRYGGSDHGYAQDLAGLEAGTERIGNSTALIKVSVTAFLQSTSSC